MRNPFLAEQRGSNLALAGAILERIMDAEHIDKARDLGIGRKQRAREPSPATQVEKSAQR
nr:hypothetical protein [Sphingomonas populi]